MGLAKPLHIRLFLEGQEVPVISAQVQIGLWAPAVASIQIVPLDSALDFKPRTMVHLFFLEEPKVTATQERMDLSEGVNGPLADKAYKLLFCGEIVGFSFVKTPMSRAVVLQCVDHSSYWDQLQATMMDYSPQGNAFVHKASFYASNAALFANVPNNNQPEKLRAWILGRPKTPGWEKVAGLAGGILNMMEIMAGLRGWRLGVNDFYSLAELRCHLLSQVAAEDGDSTSQHLLDVSVFFDWIYNNMQNLPGQVSLRDMMKMLCQYIYYQVAPNPVAKYERPDAKPKKVTWGPKDVKLSSSRYFGSCLSVIGRGLSLMNPNNTGRTKLEVAQYRTDVQLGLLAKLKSKEMAGIDKDIILDAERLDSLLGDAVEFWDSKPPGWERKVSGSYDQLELLDKRFQAAKDKTVVRQPGGSMEVPARAGLRTQIFRPDCYMAAPPTCNVIFPEMYSQMTYDRNFINEVTRVEISVYNKVVGQDALTAMHIIEPNLRGSAIEVVKHIGDKWRVLMDHELHTGIIGREEWLPDSFQVRRTSGTDAEKLAQAMSSWSHRTGLHHFFKYRIGPRTLNVAGRFMPYLVCGFPALVIQKPFQLKKDPGDQSKAIDLILNSDNPAELGAPPQFLGMVEGITHSIGQDGGTTQLSMSHCRNHLGIDDEFVGVVLDRVRKEKTETGKIYYRVSFTEAVNDPAKLEFLRLCTPQGPSARSESVVADKTLSADEAVYYEKAIENGKEVSKQKKVTVKSSKERTVKKTPSALVSSAQAPHEPAGKTIKVPLLVGERSVGGKGFLGGRIRLIEVLPPYDVVAVGDKNYFRSILVYEDVAHSTKTGTPVPVEYVVQPGWLSTSYDNENIGPKVYDQFFGCNSIVDMISLSDVGSIPERLDDKGMYVTMEEDEKAIRARLMNISSKRNFYSIEKAVNLIAYLYWKVKSAPHADADEFVSTFTWRPVATKADLLGSHDLQLKVTGSKVETVKGTVGFHTLSVHPTVVNAGQLIGLLEDPTVKMSKMSGKEMAAVKASYDVRKQKLERVARYVEDLHKGARGFVG